MEWHTESTFKEMYLVIQSQAYQEAESGQSSSNQDIDNLKNNERRCWKVGIIYDGMEKIYLLHKDDLNLLLKKRTTLPSIPPVKCSLWEELQTLSSHWGLVSEGEGDGMREDTTTFCIYSSERCQNAPLSPSSRKNLLTKKKMCEGSFFLFLFFVLMPPV